MKEFNEPKTYDVTNLEHFLKTKMKITVNDQLSLTLKKK